jgi:hypothetical protein
MKFLAILIVSTIVEGHGFTIAVRQPDMKSCAADKEYYDRILHERGVPLLAIHCNLQADFIPPKPVPPPAAAPIPSAVIPKSKPVQAKKTESKPRTFRRQSCHMMYHYIHHHRHWFCQGRRP